MSKAGNFYYNLGYWLLLYIPLAVAGFYITYFSVFFKPKPAIIHIHFALVFSWIALVIAQPFFIKYKKLAVHRFLGKVSYVLVPLVLVSAFYMLRFGYTNFIRELAGLKTGVNPKFDRVKILQQGADYILIALMYIMWFAVLYGLGVANRSKMHPHARYMLATVLTLTGPTVDRIFFIQFGVTHLFGRIPAEAVSFILIDLVLLYLLYRDKKAGRNLKPLATCVCIYLAGQVFYFLAMGTSWWNSIATFIMQPGF